MPLTLRHRAEIHRCARLYPKRRLTQAGAFWALYFAAVAVLVWLL